jgi:hypothetical protein
MKIQTYKISRIRKNQMDEQLKELKDKCIQKGLDGYFQNLDAFLEHLFVYDEHKGYHSECFNKVDKSATTGCKNIGKGCYKYFFEGKRQGSSFFPLKWNALQTIEEIVGAFQNMVEYKYPKNSLNGNIYGKSPSNVYIQFGKNKQNEITNAYPAFSQDDRDYK